MADTLLQVAQRVARKVGLDPTFTSFANTDETNDLVQYINDAYFELISALPKDTPYLNDTTNGTITTVNGTRLYSLPASTRTYNLMEWSFEDETNSDAPLEVVTLEYIQVYDGRYDEVSGKPSHIYREGSEQIGVYPVPDGAYQIKFKFAKSYTRLSATTDVFIVPDEWLRFVELKAQYYFENNKGFNNPELTLALSEKVLIETLSEAQLMTPQYFYGDLL